MFFERFTESRIDGEAGSLAAEKQDHVLANGNNGAAVVIPVEAGQIKLPPQRGA